MNRTSRFASCLAAIVIALVARGAAAQDATPAAAAATIPPVHLSEGHAELCRVKVGDTMPAITLPRLGGEAARLVDFYGSRATVVVFWKSDRRMSRTQLADLGPDVVEPFGQQGVSVVTIAVQESADRAQEVLEQTGAAAPTLIDADGAAFAQVGSARLPRTYVLDPQGRVLWFDIEYSLSTRRELQRSLRAITGARQ